MQSNIVGIPYFLVQYVWLSTYYGGTYISNENQIWCANSGEYVVFVSTVGSDYYTMTYGMVWPPVIDHELRGAIFLKVCFWMRGE